MRGKGLKLGKEILEGLVKSRGTGADDANHLFNKPVENIKLAKIL